MRCTVGALDFSGRQGLPWLKEILISRVMVAHLGVMLMGALAQAQTPGLSSPLSPAYQVAPGEPFTVYLAVDSTTSQPISARFQTFVDGSWAPVSVVSFGPYLTSGRSQASVLIPQNAPEGMGNVEVSVGGVVSLIDAVQVIGFHYVAQFRSGHTEAVLAQQYAPGRGTSDNKMTDPARPGDRIIFWGAGLGARPLDRKLELTLDGAPIPVSWTGRTPDGHDLLEFTLPADATPIDCYVRLDLRVDRLTFYGGLISTSDEAGPCRHRLGLGTPELGALDVGGYIPFVRLTGFGSMSVNGSGYSRYEQFNAYLSNSSAVDVYRATGRATAISMAGSGAACRTVAVSVSPLAPSGAFSPGGVPRTAVLNSPSSSRISMEELVAGLFLYSSPGAAPVPWTNLTPALLVSGTWSVDLPADGGYAATNVPFQIPRQIELTEPIQIPSLTQDFRARWNGSAFHPGDAVTVQFSATGSAPLVCSVSAQLGEMTVAAENLTWLWDETHAAAFLSATVSGASQPLQIQQAGVGTRYGAFNWGKSIGIALK